MTADILEGLMRANLAGGGAILLILLLRRPVRRLFGARVAYALWLIAPLAVAGSLLPEPTAATLLSPIVLTAGAAVERTVPQSMAGPGIATALAALWLAGVLAAAVVLVRRQQRFVASLGRLERVEHQPGVLRAQHDGVGPALVGALRPRIVTPADFEARFEAKEREVILAHEKVHLACGDTRINALVAVAQCLAWFNPLAHVGARALRIDQELACDAAVLARFPRARRLYAEVLLKTQFADHPLPLGCHWPPAAAHPLTERIAMLKSPLPNPALKATGLAVVAALSVGGACAAWAAKPTAAPVLVTKPDWALKPTGEDLARYYPPEALKLRMSGRTTLGCRVHRTGRLEACAVLDEAPAQQGFGAAALQLVPHFQMRPEDRDGVPTSGGEVHIPIRFIVPGDPPPSN